MALSESEKYWLNKLEASRFFTSVKDVDLLRYLLQSTYEGKNLKETVVAIEFFGKDSSFHPGTDSSVRSTIYNLRKKLDAYYLKEGFNDELHFVIPKGAYTVVVEKRTGTTRAQDAPHPTPNRLQTPLFIFSVVLVLLLAILYGREKVRNSQSTAKAVGPAWKYYQESTNPLLIVLGDYFMLQHSETNDSTLSYVRNPTINNQTDFFNYLEKHPRQKSTLKTLGQSYFGEEIPSCFYQILRMVDRPEKQVRIKNASEVTLADVQENDLIFIGDYRTMHILQPFFERSGLRISQTSNTVFIVDEQNDTTDIFFVANPEQSVFQNDYATAANVVSYPGKQILFLSSFLPFGKSEALYRLQDPDFLMQPGKNNVLPTEWRMLLKISGLQSSGFYYEVVNYMEQP